MFVLFAFLTAFLAAHATVCATHEASAAETSSSSHCAPEHEHDDHALTEHSEICFASSRDLHPAELPAPLFAPAVGAPPGEAVRWCLPEPPVAHPWSGRSLLTQVCIARV